MSSQTLSEASLAFGDRGQGLCQTASRHPSYFPKRLAEHLKGIANTHSTSPASSSSTKSSTLDTTPNCAPQPRKRPANVTASALWPMLLTTFWPAQARFGTGTCRLSGNGVYEIADEIMEDRIKTKPGYAEIHEMLMERKRRAGFINWANPVSVWGNTL